MTVVVGVEVGGGTEDRCKAPRGAGSWDQGRAGSWTGEGIEEVIFEVG